MKSALFRLGCLAVLMMHAQIQPASAQPASNRPPAVPQIDAPELAALGPLRIGTRQLYIPAANVPGLTAQGLVMSRRTIKVRVWYPAVTTPRSARTSFTHGLPRPDGKGVKFTIASLAAENASVLQGQRFPLVIVSHGYNGWDTFMTWLTENLATKGYVVVAIDHADQRATSGPERALSFGNVLLHRAADQRAVIDHFAARAANRADLLGRAIDAERIGLVGYSMGGFGVLAAAGLDYDPAGAAFAQLPAAARAVIFESQASGKAVAARVKAVVALAPFGGRADSRAWAAETVARFSKPALIIAGTDDDIVDAKGGVAWIFDQMHANRRNFLLFQNARHNVGGNPPPPAADGDFSTREYFAEPVWRTDRINAINQHFITAFLDLNLKGETAKAAYLDVAPASSADAQWPTAPSASIGGRYAADDEPAYWRGFQRRWVIGLEMRRGQPAPAGH